MEIQLLDMKTGMECFAWQWNWPIGLKAPLAKMMPVKGIFTEQPDSIGDRKRGPGWFVPYDRKGRPVFDDAVRVESVHAYSTMEEAVRGYDGAVAVTSDMFRILSEKAKGSMMQADEEEFCPEGMTRDAFRVCVDTAWSAYSSTTSMIAMLGSIGLAICPSMEEGKSGMDGLFGIQSIALLGLLDVSGISRETLNEDEGGKTRFDAFDAFFLDVYAEHRNAVTFPDDRYEELLEMLCRWAQGTEGKG